MQAVILAGGKGTRLRPYTTVLPKPLMPIGDYPILEIILRQLRHAGVDRVILAVGYMSQLFQAFLGDGSRYGLMIEYSFETEPLGTAGPLALALNALDEDFIIMNGDLLTTVDYAKLFAFHQAQRAAATIGLYPRSVKIDFGLIEQDATGKLSNYIEKPTYEFTVSMGINVLNTAAIRPYIIAGEYLDLPTLMMRLHADGHPVYCHRQNCYWLDMGRVEDYHLANEIFDADPSRFLPDPPHPRQESVGVR
jgi:NDP-mannose synthase